MLWNNSISDLHCHLLHAIDDGPREIDETMKLLELEKKQNMNKVMLTPHFNCSKMSVDDFNYIRKASYKQLCNDTRYKNLKIKTRLGAEVFYSNKLIDMNIELICFENSNYILIEFSVEILPFGITKDQIIRTMNYLLSMGYVPIIAHIERYRF